MVARRAVRLLSSAVRDRVYENSVLSNFQKSHLAPLPPSYKFDPTALSTVPTEVTKLDSGFTIASESTPSETVTIGVSISSGSRFESAKTNGTAHFLEHISFKGTESRTKEAFEAEIENIGGNVNAYTAREQTLYYARVHRKHTAQAVDILSDMMLRSRLDEQAIEAERGTILREHQEVSKQVEEVVMDMLHETAYVGCGLGRPILGSTDNIRNITRQYLQDYIRANYTAPRMSLIGTGGVEHKYLVELGSKAFASLRREPEVAPEPVDRSIFVGSSLSHRDDSLPLAHVGIAFEGVPWAHGDSVAQMVMQAMLGNYTRAGGNGANSGSNLSVQLAAHDLCESASTFNTFYTDTSLFGAFVTCDATKIQDSAWVVLREMVNLAHRTTDEDVQRAQIQLKTMFMLQLDDSASTLEDIARQLAVYGRRLSLSEIFARIDAVDAPTVRRLANTIVNDRDLAVAAHGPLYEMPDYNWLRRRTYMLRF